MKNLSLEERVLYSNLSPSVVEVNGSRAKTEIQYTEEGRKIIASFNDSLIHEQTRLSNLIPFSIESPENFIEFFNHLKDAWTTYLNLSLRMGALSENLQFLFPEKLELFRDLVETTFNLNTHIYFITDVEKEIYETNIGTLPEERAISLIQSVRSFPVYLSEEIGQAGTPTQNPYEIREILAQNPNLRKLFSLAGSSIPAFGKLLKHFAPLGRKSERETFEPQNDYEAALKEILAYDHFFELFLRESGILMTDLKFYIDLANRFSCSREIPSILTMLDQSIESAQQTFSPRIPSYTQTALSCGATCLANTVGTYFPNVVVDRHLENGIHKLVTVPGFFNNLPSSLALVSRERFGIPSHFFADYATFAPWFLDNKAEHEPVKKFQEDYERVKSSALDYGNITTDEIRAKLRRGHFISFVTGQSPMLHYKMIIGYNFRGDKNQFHVFDPSYGVTRMDESDILIHMRNDKSLWGIEYVPPESVMFGPVRESIARAKELLAWNPQ